MNARRCFWITVIIALVMTGCDTPRNLVIFPSDSIPMKIRGIAGKPDDIPTPQDIEQLVLKRCYTYEVETKDLVSGQIAKKSLVWAVYPGVERENKKEFPVELIVKTKQPVTPKQFSRLHSNFQTEVRKVWGKSWLRWMANERIVPGYFGYFGLTAPEQVTGVEIQRECIPLGNGRARLTIAVKAQMPLLIRIWGLKGKFANINIEPESIEPKDYRLSDNGVLFFDYGKNLEEVGSERKYSFVFSGLKEGYLFYPMTNARHHVQTCSYDCPMRLLKEVRGSVWEFDFTLRSKRGFRIARLESWIEGIYQLNQLATIVE